MSATAQPGIRLERSRNTGNFTDRGAIIPRTAAELLVAFPEEEAFAMLEMQKAVDGLLACEPMSERFHDTLIVLRLTQASLDAARVFA